MKVKLFDEGHEKDLELAINEFLCDNDIDVVDISNGHLLQKESKLIRKSGSGFR